MKAHRDRKRQIEGILQYLDTQYSYDMAMVENNIVRPLTTEEALGLGKGVCQHYSVIFTAIARALKIPTRIVLGYHLSGKGAGSHAWVESEITPGTWQVIEPQDKDTLNDMHTRFYFPTMRATFLEDKNQNWGDLYPTFLSQDLTFKPAQ